MAPRLATFFAVTDEPKERPGKPSPIVLPLLLGLGIAAIIAFVPVVAYRLLRPDLGLTIIGGACWYVGTWYLFGRPRYTRHS
jgi:hypothetical protein